MHKPITHRFTQTNTTLTFRGSITRMEMKTVMKIERIHLRATAEPKL